MRTFKPLYIGVFTLLLTVPVKAQIPADYEIATWHQFKTAAISYTFDDKTGKQISVALPLFDQYNYKTTLFTVTDWITNWDELVEVSNKGHEIASHTLSHPDLSTLPPSEQENQLTQSLNVINSKITDSKCVTIAYPYCKTGDISLINKYYIAGRICSGAIVPSSPADFCNISSIPTGSESSVRTTADFNNKVSLAKSSKGWCVFLIHGIDDDQGYSPTQSSELSMHLSYVNSNTADYWVATFATVAKYIKERDSASIIETTCTPDKLYITVTDNLDNNTFNVPITIKRLLSSSWNDAKVSINDELINSNIITSGDKKYVVFDVVPDQSNILIENVKTN